MLSHTCWLAAANKGICIPALSTESKSYENMKELVIQGSMTGIMKQYLPLPLFDMMSLQWFAKYSGNIGWNSSQTLSKTALTSQSNPWDTITWDEPRLSHFSIVDTTPTMMLHYSRDTSDGQSVGFDGVGIDIEESQITTSATTWRPKTEREI